MISSSSSRKTIVDAGINSSRTRMKPVAHCSTKAAKTKSLQAGEAAQTGNARHARQSTEVVDAGHVVDAVVEVEGVECVHHSVGVRR